jgi:RNA polymerase sigma-70 factor (ECF subfamily)
VPAIRDSLEELIEKDWEQAVATVALARVKAKVKPKHFQMFDLYALKNWPIRRVSRTLQVNVAQVYLAKSRIMRLLKKQSLQVEAQLLHSLQQTPKPKTDL